jgi:hypothetical protein
VVCNVLLLEGLILSRYFSLLLPKYSACGRGISPPPAQQPVCLGEEGENTLDIGTDVI